MGTSHSPKLLHYWNLTIRLFSVISRTLVGGGYYPSAENQSVYSTAQADWAKQRPESERRNEVCNFGNCFGSSLSSRYSHIYTLMQSAKDVADFPFLCFVVLNPLFCLFFFLPPSFFFFNDVFCSASKMPTRPGVRGNNGVLTRRSNNQPAVGLISYLNYRWDPKRFFHCWSEWSWKSNSSIWPINSTLSCATTLVQSRPGSNGNERVLHIPQSSSITEASSLDCLVSYAGHLLWESYPSAENQSVYSVAPTDWAAALCEMLTVLSRIELGSQCPIHTTTNVTRASTNVNRSMKENDFILKKWRWHSAEIYWCRLLRWSSTS